VAFDLLNLEGHSLLGEPLAKRQRLLARLVRQSAVQLSEPIDASLETVLQAVASLGMEGVVAKRRDSRYAAGMRGRLWFKFRTGHGQEFVIGGMKRGDPFESLLLGYYEGRRLHYAGKTRAGLVPNLKRAIYALLEPLTISKCPFVDLPQRSPGRWGDGLTAEKMNDCIWIKPKLVAQVSFVEWTDQGILRHPKFLGLRDDKRPREVVRER
jgi:bifunctional non-homologous end joining protein LigD